MICQLIIYRMIQICFRLLLCFAAKWDSPEWRKAMGRGLSGQFSLKVLQNERLLLLQTPRHVLFARKGFSIFRKGKSARAEARAQYIGCFSKVAYSTRNAPASESITRPSGSVIRAGTPAGHFASMEKRPSFIVQRTETMPMGVGTSPAA